MTVEAAIPCPGQADAWPADQRARYERLVAACDLETLVSSQYSPSCMQRRDRYMVDHAALLIAAFDGTAGGTRYTVEYAMRRGVSIVDLDILPGPGRPGAEAFENQEESMLRKFLPLLLGLTLLLAGCTLR